MVDLWPVLVMAVAHISPNQLLYAAKADRSCCGCVVELTGAVALQDIGTWKEAQQGQDHFHQSERNLVRKMLLLWTTSTCSHAIHVCSSRSSCSNSSLLLSADEASSMVQGVLLMLWSLPQHERVVISDIMRALKQASA